MTEATVLELIREDFRGVKASVDNLGGEVSGMKSTMVSVKETLDRHETAIKETHDAQLSCMAAGGWDGINREMKQVHATAQKDRDHVDDELKELRGEQTGQFDVPRVAVPAEKRSNGSAAFAMFKTFGPWIAIIALGLIGLGAYFGSGGDEDRAIQVMRKFQQEIFLKVDKIEKKQTEPVHVPVPITMSDAYSEEILP